MIRFEGFTESFAGGSLNAVYLIEISFKDGKYKFDPIKFTLTNDGIHKFEFFETFSSYFKSDGNVKERLKATVSGVESKINGLNASLKDYIIGKKSDW